MSDSDSSSDDEKKESLDDKMKRLTKLGKGGDMDGLLQEASLMNCTPEMIAFAAMKSKEMGNEAFAKKEYEQALEHYAGALVGDAPEKHKIFSNRSACMFQLGKYTEALVEATKAIKVSRDWSKGYFRAGRAALEMEYYQEALEMFEKGLEKEPDNKDLLTWAKKARDIRNQHKQTKLMKKHATDYSKFDEISKQQQDEEDEEEAMNDPNRVILGDKYYSSSKMEQRQLKAMLGYKEAPPPPFQPKFDPDMIYRHDSRGTKTQNPVWDPTRREWRIDAKPAPSRVDYSDSEQTQAIALFLERQTDVAHAAEWLSLLDENAAPIDAYCRAVRDIISQQLGPKGKAQPIGGGMNVNAGHARWLFIGVGTALPIMTAARYLPTAEIIGNSAHRAHYIADLAMSVLVQNGVKRDQVKFIHRPSQDLAVVDPDGEDINNLTGKVDIVTLDHELFDAGLLGKGVLAKVAHVKRKLVATDHMIMPMSASISCVPCEILCPNETGPDGLNWSTVDECRWGAFYEATNLDSNGINEPWKPLGPVLEVFDFDFTEAEVKLSGQADLHFKVKEGGTLNCVAFWYKLNLTENVVLDHTPEDLRPAGSAPPSGDYYRHATQWLASPMRVEEGDDVHIRASYSRSRVRFEVVSPEVPKKDRRYACPRWMMIRFWDGQRTEAFKKAIEKAVEKIVAERELVPKLDRPQLRVVHLGAGLGQVSMIAAQCLREAAISDHDIETYGYTVVALEQMPKAADLTRHIFRDNGLEQDVFFCAEDVRKLPAQPHRSQLIISELIDPGLLGEGMLPLLSAARVKMCNAFEHQVIPARATIWAAAFEFGENLSSFNGFDLSALNHYRTGNMVDVDGSLEKGSARQITNVFEVFKFNFLTNELPSAHTIEIQPIADGKVNAIVFWYEIAMDEEGDIILTNWPEALPPADFAMMEKDLHRPRPLRQAVTYFHGDYIKTVTRGEPIELDVGYTQAWPQFVWPGTEMVQKESGESIPKPPPMPRHKLHFEKMKHETEELEKKLQGGLMYDEEMLGDGFAAAERVALEPNGNPNYMIDPTNANYFHMMFFL